MNRSFVIAFLKVSLVLVLITAIAYYFGEREVRKKGYQDLWSFLSTSFNNYRKSFDGEPEVMAIRIDEVQLEKINALVEKARLEGVIPRKGNKFRKAELLHNGVTHQVEMRIKGKLTDHVEGDKWSLRVKVTDGSEVMGMRRFSLQHPGTRNYANEWVFHEMAKAEGLIALRYDYVEVELNDNDLGVYAMEEHFGQELLLNNGRVPGPILRFDPGLYWQHRLNMMDDIHVTEEYAEFINSNIDPYTEGTILKDSSLIEAFYRGQAKLEAFRLQELPVDSVFKITPLARYHALIDLVGGHHSLDWSDVKYYYDPLADRIEPVAYESFSVFPTKALAGSYRYTGRKLNDMDLHDALFNNETFFRAYVQELRRLSDPKYLEGFFGAIRSELEKKLAILYSEFPYKEFSTEQYVKNAAAINAMLDTPQGIHAYLQRIDTSSGELSVHFRLGMIESLPIEIVGFRTNEKEELKCADLGLTSEQCILPSKKRRSPIVVHDLVAKFPKGVAVDPSKKKGWRVMYRVLGDEKELKVTVLPYSFLPDMDLDTISSEQVQVPQPMIFVLPGTGKDWMIKQGTWELNEAFIVPEDVRLTAGSGVKILFAGKGSLEVFGELEFEGDQEHPVHLSSGSDCAAIVLQPNSRSKFKSVLFEQTGGAPLIVSNSRLELDRCRFIQNAGPVLVCNTGGVISNGNVFVNKSSDPMLELNAARLLSKGDRRVGQATLISGIWAYIEILDFRSNTSGTLLTLDESEVVLFSPEVKNGERIHAKGKCRIEVRDLDPELTLDLQLAAEVELVINGDRVASLELVSE